MLHRARVWTVGVLLVLVAIAIRLSGSAAEQPRSTRSLHDLGDAFARGLYLQDRNGDGVIDFIDARIVVPADATPRELVAAANVAARLGFESSAFTPGLAVRDTDLTPTAGTPPLILIGSRNRLVERVRQNQKIDWGELRQGQGVVALVNAPFGGADAMIIAGADDDGMGTAADAFAARWPYLWQLRGPSVRSVEGDVRALAAKAGVRLSDIHATLAVYDRGHDQVTRLVIEATAPREFAPKVAAAFEVIARAHEPGHARFGDREADTLNYYGLATLEVRVGGQAVRIDRFGPAYLNNAPTNPWTPAVKSLDLATLYTIYGLFGDSRGNDRIPDETETTLIIGSSAGPVIEVIDLAARIALESTGVSLPLARVDTDIADAVKVPNPIFVGAGKLRDSLPGFDAAPGEGRVDVVPRGFGVFPAVVVSGGDAVGLNAAASYLASHVPYLWEARRGEVSYQQIRDDLTAFFRVRSTAGQAARATLALEDVLADLQTKGTHLQKVRADAYLEEETPGFGTFLQQVLKARTGAADVSASAPSRYGPVTIFEDSPELGWEVDDLRDRIRRDLLPQIKTGDRVALEITVSEAPELRRDLQREFEGALLQAGAASADVRVICAYKQGFSWLADYVLPALHGKAARTITVRYPMAQYAPGRTWYGVGIRWLLEVFPADEVFARELRLDVDATRFERVEVGPVEYQVEAKDATGRVVYTDKFAPRYVEREYFPYKPTAHFQYTTGGFTATINGKQAADVHIATDPERLWDHYLTKALPRVFDYVRQYTGGNLGPEYQPFFRDLIFDITMSEPDFRFGGGLDEERISPLDSLHEDLWFDTLDFFNMFTGRPAGSRDVAVGRVMPMIHPVTPGKPPHVTITLLGNAVPHPRLVVSWRSVAGEDGSRSIDLDAVPVDAPHITGVVVRSEATGATRLTAAVTGKNFEAASIAARMVDALARIQHSGALRGALAYARLGTLAVESRAGSAALVQTLAPPDRSVLPAPASARVIPPEPGHRIVTWDHVIGPDELEQEILPRLRAFPEINPYIVGRTYRNRNVWAMDVMLPMEATIWSQAKASTLKPALFITTRQHANEVSATSAHLRFMELLATDPAYRQYLKRVNIVYNPIENPDGAANHQEFYKLTPSYILHAGYWSSVGRGVESYVFDPDPLLPEGLVRRKIYETWLPDVYMNPHGYPSHEWVQQFAGFKVPFMLWYWIPAGYHIDLYHMHDPAFPKHEAVASDLRDRIIDEVMSIPSVRTINARLLHRYEKYGRGEDPYPFSLEIYKGMDIIYNYDYSFNADPPAGHGTYISSLWKHPDPNGGAARGDKFAFVQRDPQITVLAVGCDMPDETASPEWMENMAARGQFGYLTAMMKLITESTWSVERYEDDFQPAVRLSVFRPRPLTPAHWGQAQK